jgi:hypothetical protein
VPDRAADGAVVLLAAGLLGAGGLQAERRERREAGGLVLSTMVSEYGFTERILPGVQKVTVTGGCPIAFPGALGQRP